MFPICCSSSNLSPFLCKDKTRHQKMSDFNTKRLLYNPLYSESGEANSSFKHEENSRSYFKIAIIDNLL